MSTASAEKTAEMTERERQLEPGVPPVGEEIHLPGPSALPFVCAIGITLTIIGLTIDWLWTVIGLITFIVTLVMWIRDVHRDISDLPEDHAH